MPHESRDAGPSDHPIQVEELQRHYQIKLVKLHPVENAVFVAKFVIIALYFYNVLQIDYDVYKYEYGWTEALVVLAILLEWVTYPVTFVLQYTTEQGRAKYQYIRLLASVLAWVIRFLLYTNWGYFRRMVFIVVAVGVSSIILWFAKVRIAIHKRAIQRSFDRAVDVDPERQ